MSTCSLRFNYFINCEGANIPPNEEALIDPEYHHIYIILLKCSSILDKYAYLTTSS